jgi:spore coat protein U-like protein
MKRIALLAALLALTLTPAFGATTAVTHGKKTTTLTVKGSVSTTCLLTTSPFTFSIGIGYIHSPGNAVVKQNTLGVKCTKGATTQITMDTGLYGSAAGAQFGSRSMKSPNGDFMGYELCHDSACSAVWTPQGYNYISPSDTGSSIPVWTRIKTGQSQVKQGSHTDSVTVTISF